MRKLILIVHTSMDGFVAGVNGDFTAFNPSPENLDLVCRLTEEADAALMGRVSYQLLNSFWPTAREKSNATDSEIKYSNWYNEAEKIVLSTSLPAKGLLKTTVLSENVEDEIRAIKAQRGKNIIMFGSPTAFKTLNESDLIDEYWVIYYPVIFSEGIPFFTSAKTPKRFKLLDTKCLSNGEIAINYHVVK